MNQFYLILHNAKKDLYSDTKDIRGFKIDIRFIINVSGKEVNVAMAELAKHGTEDKAILDFTKLSREGVSLSEIIVFYFAAFYIQNQ